MVESATQVSDFMTQDVMTVEIPGNRDEVLKIFRRTGISGIPVTRNKKIVGMITRKDLLRNPEETQLGLLMTPDPVIIGPDMDIRDAADLLIRHKVRKLPVEKDGHLVGLLSVTDLIRALARLRENEEIRKRYTSQPFALWEETPLPVVARVMEISGVDAIPILDAETHLQGIISERDLIRCSNIEDCVQVSDFSSGNAEDEWNLEGIRDSHSKSFGISRIHLPNRPVKLAMVRNVVAVPQNADVNECARKMIRAGFDQLPVSGDKDLVGMLYDWDLIKVMCD